MCVPIIARNETEVVGASFFELSIARSRSICFHTSANLARQVKRKKRKEEEEEYSTLLLLSPLISLARLQLLRMSPRHY
jgi:hypothetical protein